MQNETQNQDTQAATQQPVMEEAQAAPQQAMDDTQAATSEVHDDPGIPQQQEQQGIAVGEPDPGSPGGEPLSEEALGIGIEDISADPSASDPFGEDDFSPLSPEDDFSGSDPKVTMNLEDLFGPETIDNFWDSPGNPENPSDSLPGDGIDWDPSSWGFGDSDVPDPAATTGIIVDPVPTDQAEPPDSEAAAPLSPEAVSMPIDKIVDPVPTDKGEGLPGDSGEEDGDATAGGYDGSGIAGGLDLDQDGKFDQIENNPDMPGEGYTYDEGAYEDAEDALEDLQDALQDGDEGDLAEALEELQGYLGGFDKGNEEDENPDPTGAGPEEAKDATGDDSAAGANAQEDPEDPSGGVMEDGGEGGINPADVDYQEVLHDLDSGNLDDVREFLEGLAGGGNDEEEAKDAPGASGHEHGHFANEGISLDDVVGEKDEYAYDEEAYEDAEDAFKDLRHALKHGDEEDRAEALQKLQGYLGGFDKGNEEKDQDGTETQDGQIPSVSEEDSDGDTIQDFVDLNGDGTDDRKEDSDGDGTSVDAPDASGAAVSGAAAGAGAVGEAGDLGDLDLSDVFDDIFLGGSGDGDEEPVDAPDQTGQWITGSNGDIWVDASGNISDPPPDQTEVDAPDASGAAVSGAAVGAGAAAGAGAAVGAGDIVENIANGNFDGAIDAAAEQAGGAIDDALGIEGSGKVLDQVANGDFEEAYDAVVDYGADQAGDWIGEQLGSEELGDTASEVFNHVANGDFEEAFDTAVDGIGDAAEDLWDSIF